MDFSNRVQQHSTTSQPQVNLPASEAIKKNRRLPVGKGWRMASMGLLIGIVILIVAVLLLLHFNGNGEYSYVNTKTFQAVDINVAGSSSDQIYFGNVKAINNGYVILDNVFYIPSSSSSTSISLQPLVCLVDAPYNRMVINRNSVNWWENLLSSGQVSKAITKYQKNPTKCNSGSSPSSNTSNNTSSNSSTNSNSPTNPNTNSSTGSSNTSTGSSNTTDNTTTGTSTTGNSTTNTNKNPTNSTTTK